MANQLLTIGGITSELLRLFMNSNAMLENVNKQYDDKFAVEGAKIGNSLNIRLPWDPIVGNGPTITPQNVVETYTTLKITSQKNVPFSFSSADMSLSIDRFADRYLRPAANNLAGQVAADLMSAVDGYGGDGQGPAQHFVHNVDANNNTTTPTPSTITAAGAILTQNGAPEGPGKRVMMLSPISESRITPGLIGLFNPQRQISNIYRTGLFSEDTLGFDIMHDQTILNHVTGSFTGTTINGAGQTGPVLVVAATTGALAQGDVIMVAGVSSVNRTTKVSANTPRMFVVTAAVPAGSTAIPIYPSLIPSNAGAQQNYQTVDVSPASGAAVTLANKAGEIYRTNIAYVPEAFTLATADLELPNGVHMAARRQFGGVSMRIVGQYNIMTDQFIYRADILYGYALLRPEWVVRVADAI